MGDALTKGLESFLSNLINEALGHADTALGNIADVAINSENYMKSSLGLDFSKVYTIILSYAIYLIVLKYIKKGFDVYVLWDEGDADMDPFIMFTSLCKSIIIAASFDTIYIYISDIALDIIDTVLNSFNTADIDLTATGLIKAAVSAFLNNGIFMVIIALIYLIMYIYLWIQFIKRGLELFILKKGIPFACIGMIDSDGGVFKPYCKKIIQELFTVFIQIILLKMSLIIMINGHFFWGIAAMSYSIKTPQFLQEFIMMNQGGGISTKVSQTAYMANMLRNFKN